MRLRVVALHLLGWTAIALITASQTLLTYAATGGTVLVRPVILISLALWYSWGAVSPAIIAAARRWPLTRATWPARLPLHIALNLTIALVATLLNRVVREAVGLPPRGSFTLGYLNALNSALLVYWSLYAIVRGLSFYRHARDREVQAAALDRELAEARLGALRAQIHPHFLFNTLHAIASEIRRDARTAEDMLGALGELLRSGLDSTPRQEVTLADELQFIERYLSIQRIRFKERLAVEHAIDPAVLETRVPVLLLQPLVENAIEHGIAQRRAGGTLRLGARPVGSDVVIEVADNGPGAGTGNGSGRALANTRARLEALYGAAARLETASTPDGFVARITVPRGTLDATDGA